MREVSEISPVAGESARGEELARGIVESYEKDPQALWNTDMFGKTFKEMVGRVNAQLRRYYEFNTQEKSERVYGKMKISSTRHEVKVDGETVNLTLKDGKFRFAGHCLGCTACSFNCPTNAINIGMLNGWKVNGAYNFGASTDGLTEKDVCRYCHKSYIRYFERHGIILGKDKK